MEVCPYVKTMIVGHLEVITFRFVFNIFAEYRVIVGLSGECGAGSCAVDEGSSKVNLLVEQLWRCDILS